MMSRNEWLINGGLVVGILIALALLFTLEPRTHTGEYTRDEIEKIKIGKRGSSDPGIDDSSTSGSAYTHFGMYAIFESVITPIPPTPTPAPTPDIPPDLRTILTNRFTFHYAFGGDANFTDKNNNENFTLRVGDQKEIEYGRYKIVLRLKSIDENSFSATLSDDRGEEVVYSLADPASNP